MVKYPKVIGFTVSVVLLGSLAHAGSSTKKPVFKGSASFLVSEEASLNAYAKASPGYKNQVVNYSLLSGPDGLSLSSTTGQMVWTPSHSQTSNPYKLYTVKVKAYDASNTSVYTTKSFQVKVVQVNTTPTVSCTSSVNVPAGDKMLLQATASDPDVGQTVKFSLSGAPSGATVNASTGLISWTPKSGTSGTYSFTVVGKDNGLPKLSSSAPVSVTVAAANRAPSLSGVSAKTATVGTELSFTATATDPDSGQTLSYSLVNAPTGASIDASTGKFTWTPTSDQISSSSYSMKVRVTDDGSPSLYDEETLTVTVQAASTTQTVSFASKTGPVDNPLKGWAYKTLGGTNSVMFTYVAWKDLEPSDGYFDFTAVDKYLNSGANAGKHIIFRIYLDYPGITSGVPQWLVNSGVDMVAYGPKGATDSTTVDGYTPDYNNTVLQSRITRLIGKLGERFNTDPRIAFIQIGVMGQYGEWTTYRAGSTLRYSVASQNAILDAFNTAFPDKKLLGRHPGISYDPTSVTAGSNYPIGYHDDMFPYQTYGVMMPNMVAKGKQTAWKTAPMGGELWPHREDLMLCDLYTDLKISSTNSLCFSSASQPFTSSYVGTKWRIMGQNGFTSQDITIVSVDDSGVATASASLGTLGSVNGTMKYIDDAGVVWNSVYEMALDRVRAFHPTMMGLTPANVTNTRANSQTKLDNLARLMGYQFRMTSMTAPKELKVGQDNSLTLNLVNEGVAPFYYKWKVSVALMDGDIVKQQVELPWDIRNWLPGSIAESLTLNPTVAAGTYDLAIKIEDPWSLANKPGIEFANNLRFDTSGWTHLMSVTVK